MFEGKVANEFLVLGAFYKQFAPFFFLLTQVTYLIWVMLNPDTLKMGSLGNNILVTNSDIKTAQVINCQRLSLSIREGTQFSVDAQGFLKVSKFNQLSQTTLCPGARTSPPMNTLT
jgi:hypothetical protein